MSNVEIILWFSVSDPCAIARFAVRTFVDDAPNFYLDDHVHGSDDELKMKRGDIIYLDEMDEEFGDGWWFGHHPGSGQKGLFPAGMRFQRGAPKIRLGTNDFTS